MDLEPDYLAFNSRDSAPEERLYLLEGEFPLVRDLLVKAHPDSWGLKPDYTVYLLPPYDTTIVETLFSHRGFNRLEIAALGHRLLLPNEQP